MADAISLALIWFANYTNFYSIVSVIICLSVMVIFILRLNGDHFLPNSATHYRVVKEQPMVKLTNPLSVHLGGEKPSSLKGGIHLQLSMLRAASVTAVWGVNIQAFQRELQKASAVICDRLLSGRIFDEQYLHSVQCGLITNSDSSVDVFIKPPAAVTEDVLGEPPRKMYPAVIVSVLQDIEISLEYTAIVLQFTVLHLKDSVCPLDSHIVYQFLKTNHSHILSLQPIFMSTTEDQDNLVTSPTPGGNTSRGEDSHIDTTPGSSKINVASVDNITPTSSQLENSAGVYVCNNIRDADTIAGIGTSSAEHNGHDDRNITEDSDASNMCVVCQSSPIFYTLLTCRHACVCQTCVSHLDRCPMCRSYIDAYFRMSDRPIESSDADFGNVVHRPSRWEMFNQWFNDLLGLN